MPASPRPVGKAALRSARTPPRPQLTRTTGCDTAFRMIAGRCIGDLTANHAATCRGDPIALHRMRIALTQLRTAISFFSPMVADSQRTRIRHELKWLNAHLGAVRDLDVAVVRLGDRPKATAASAGLSTLQREARHGHTRLARTLRSAKCWRLINDTSTWIANGSWSTQKGNGAERVRALPIAAFSSHKLAQWKHKLVKKSRKLMEMGTRRRHRLRLRNKKLSYSVEFFKELFPGEIRSRQKRALKYLRRAQKSLGQLNDDARGPSLARASGVKTSLQLLGPKREGRLIKVAAAAYRKLAGLEASVKP